MPVFNGSKILLKLPALIIAAFIWFLSSRSSLPELKSILAWDLFQHFLAFGALAFTAGLWPSVIFWKRRPVFAALLSALPACAYGAIDELHQFFVPGRDSSVTDWIADTAGAVFGAAAMMLFAKKALKTRIVDGVTSGK